MQASIQSKQPIATPAESLGMEVPTIVAPMTSSSGNTPQPRKTLYVSAKKGVVTVLGSSSHSATIHTGKPGDIPSSVLNKAQKIVFRMDKGNLIQENATQQTAQTGPLVSKSNERTLIPTKPMISLLSHSKPFALKSGLLNHPVTTQNNRAQQGKEQESVNLGNEKSSEKARTFAVNMPHGKVSLVSLQVTTDASNPVTKTTSTAGLGKNMVSLLNSRTNCKQNFSNVNNIPGKVIIQRSTESVPYKIIEQPQHSAQSGYAQKQNQQQKSVLEHEPPNSKRRYVRRGIKAYMGEKVASSFVAVSSAEELDTSLTNAEVFMCKICSQVWASVESIREHLAEHPKCSVCLQCFPDEEKLHNHLEMKTACSSGMREADLVPVHPANSETSTVHAEDTVTRIVCTNDKTISSEVAAPPLENHQSEDGFEERMLAVAEPQRNSSGKICPACSVVFPTISGLLKHAQSHKPTQFFQCTVCENLFMSHNAYTGHLSQCNDKTSSKKSSRVSEMKGESNNNTSSSRSKQIQCPECEETFEKESLLINHLITHIVKENGGGGDKDVLSCKECQTSFYNRDSLHRHIVKEHMRDDDKSLVACHLCFESFQGKRALLSHYRKHLHCHICHVGFQSRAEMNQHNRTQHSGRYPWACQQCDSIFRTKAALKHHVQKHGVKKHACGDCGQDFLVVGDLLQHQLAVHKAAPRIRDHQCAYCRKWFYRRTHLVAHQRTHFEREELQCPHCPVKCKTQKNLTTHIRRHTGELPVKCKLCGQGFIDHCYLYRHMLRHKPAPDLKCHLCNKAFYSRQNLKSHVQNNHWVCFDCEQRFLERSSITHHLKECLRKGEARFLRHSYVSQPGSENVMEDDRVVTETDPFEPITVKNEVVIENGEVAEADGSDFGHFDEETNTIVLYEEKLKEAQDKIRLSKSFEITIPHKNSGEVTRIILEDNTVITTTSEPGQNSKPVLEEREKEKGTESVVSLAKEAVAAQRLNCTIAAGNGLLLEAEKGAENSGKENGPILSAVDSADCSASSGNEKRISAANSSAETTKQAARHLSGSKQNQDYCTGISLNTSLGEDIVQESCRDRTTYTVTDRVQDGTLIAGEDNITSRDIANSILCEDSSCVEPSETSSFTKSPVFQNKTELGQESDKHFDGQSISICHDTIVPGKDAYADNSACGSICFEDSVLIKDVFISEQCGEHLVQNLDSNLQAPSGDSSAVPAGSLTPERVITQENPLIQDNTFTGQGYMTQDGTASVDPASPYCGLFQENASSETSFGEAQETQNAKDGDGIPCLEAGRNDQIESGGLDLGASTLKRVRKPSAIMSETSEYYTVPLSKSKTDSKFMPTPNISQAIENGSERQKLVPVQKSKVRRRKQANPSKAKYLEAIEALRRKGLLKTTAVKETAAKQNVTAVTAQDKNPRLSIQSKATQSLTTCAMNVLPSDQDQTVQSKSKHSKLLSPEKPVSFNLGESMAVISSKAQLKNFQIVLTDVRNVLQKKLPEQTAMSLQYHVSASGDKEIVHEGTMQERKGDEDTHRTARKRIDSQIIEHEQTTRPDTVQKKNNACPKKQDDEQTSIERRRKTDAIQEKEETDIERKQGTDKSQAKHQTDIEDRQENTAQEQTHESAQLEENQQNQTMNIDFSETVIEDEPSVCVKEVSLAKVTLQPHDKSKVHVPEQNLQSLLTPRTFQANSNSSAKAQAKTSNVILSVPDGKDSSKMVTVAFPINKPTNKRTPTIEVLKRSVTQASSSEPRLAIRQSVDTRTRSKSASRTFSSLVTSSRSPAKSSQGTVPDLKTTRSISAGKADMNLDESARQMETPEKRATCDTVKSLDNRTPSVRQSLPQLPQSSDTVSKDSAFLVTTKPVGLEDKTSSERQSENSSQFLQSSDSVAKDFAFQITTEPQVDPSLSGIQSEQVNNVVEDPKLIPKMKTSPDTPSCGSHSHTVSLLSKIGNNDSSVDSSGFTVRIQPAPKKNASATRTARNVLTKSPQEKTTTARTPKEIKSPAVRIVSAPRNSSSTPKSNSGKKGSRSKEPEQSPTQRKRVIIAGGRAVTVESLPPLPTTQHENRDTCDLSSSHDQTFEQPEDASCAEITEKSETADKSTKSSKTPFEKKASAKQSRQTAKSNKTRTAENTGDIAEKQGINREDTSKNNVQSVEKSSSQKKGPDEDVCLSANDTQQQTSSSTREEIEINVRQHTGDQLTLAVRMSSPRKRKKQERAQESEIMSSKVAGSVTTTSTKRQKGRKNMSVSAAPIVVQSLTPGNTSTSDLTVVEKSKKMKSRQVEFRKTRTNNRKKQMSRTSAAVSTEVTEVDNLTPTIEQQRAAYDERDFTDAVMEQPENALQLECDVCHQHFLSATDIQQHLQSVHMRSEFYQCSHCVNVFSSLPSLTTHFHHHAQSAASLVQSSDHRSASVSAGETNKEPQQEMSASTPTRMRTRSVSASKQADTENLEGLMQLCEVAIALENEPDAARTMSQFSAGDAAAAFSSVSSFRTSSASHNLYSRARDLSTQGRFLQSEQETAVSNSSVAVAPPREVAMVDTKWEALYSIAGQMYTIAISVPAAAINSTKEQSTVNSTKDQSAINSTKEQSAINSTKEQSAINSTKEQSAINSTKEQSAINSTKERPAKSTEERRSDCTGSSVKSMETGTSRNNHLDTTSASAAVDFSVAAVNVSVAADVSALTGVTAAATSVTVTSNPVARSSVLKHAASPSRQQLGDSMQPVVYVQKLKSKELLMNSIDATTVEHKQSGKLRSPKKNVLNSGKFVQGKTITDSKPDDKSSPKRNFPRGREQKLESQGMSRKDNSLDTQLERDGSEGVLRATPKKRPRGAAEEEQSTPSRKGRKSLRLK